MFNIFKIFILTFLNGINPAGEVDLQNLPEIKNPLFEEYIRLYKSPGRISEVYYSYTESIITLSEGLYNILTEADTIDNVLKQMNKIPGFIKANAGK